MAINLIFMAALFGISLGCLLCGETIVGFWLIICGTFVILSGIFNDMGFYNRYEE